MNKKLSKFFSITFDADEEIESKRFGKFLHIFTELGSTIGAVAIIALLTLISGPNLLYVFLPIYVFQLLMVEALKILFKRPRPNSHQQKNLFGKRVTGGSFPSGHTSNVFTLAFLISNFYQLHIAFIALVFCVAGLIAYSRVLLGRHYVIDVAAGSLSGLVFSLIGALLLPQFLMYIL